MSKVRETKVTPSQGHQVRLSGGRSILRNKTTSGGKQMTEQAFQEKEWCERRHPGKLKPQGELESENTCVYFF